MTPPSSPAPSFFEGPLAGASAPSCSQMGLNQAGPSNPAGLPVEIPAPAQDQAIAFLSEEEEAKLWEQSDTFILKNLTDLENQIQDEIQHLRKEERMRSLGPERMARTVEDLTERYGLQNIPDILNNLKTKGKESHYYKETQVFVRELDREKVTCNDLKSEWFGKSPGK